MDRRAFVSTVALSFLAAPLAAPQAGRITRIGWLSAGSATIFASRIAAFRQGLREHGYTDESLFIEPRWADGKEELLPVLAAEIIGLKVALLVTVGTPASLAAKQVTETVPIVMIAVGDPVGTGLAKSLARPGGNSTGISTLAADLTPSY